MTPLFWLMLATKLWRHPVSGQLCSSVTAVSALCALGIWALADSVYLGLIFWWLGWLLALADGLRPRISEFGLLASAALAIALFVQSPDVTHWAATLLSVLCGLGLAFALVAQPARLVSGLAVTEPKSRSWSVLARKFLLGALAAGGLAPLLPNTVWAWLLAAGLALTLGLWGLIQAARARSARPLLRRRVRTELMNYAPVLAIYSGRQDGGVHQISMWLPALEKLNLPYVILLRSATALEAVQKVTSAPVLALDSWSDLDLAVVPSLRVAFYVNAAGTNTNFIGYRQLKHVYLGHGESDKDLSSHPSHVMYDQVFVAGQAALDRYQNSGVSLRPGAGIIIGRPQTVTFSTQDPNMADRILYAPTWRGYNSNTNYSSLRFATEIVAGLLARNLPVIFRPHPFSFDSAADAGIILRVDRLLAEDRKKTGKEHVLAAEARSWPFVEAANRSSGMICDVSSVLVDYLSTDKPFVVFSDSEELPPGGVRADGGCPLADIMQLDAAISQLTGADSAQPQRAQARARLLGGLTGEESVEAFCSAVRELVQQ